MKKILLGLAVFGLMHITAHAQKNSGSKYDQNFKVCKNEQGYTVCGTLPSSTNTTADKPSAPEQKTEKQSKYAINYPVCVNKNGYTTCSEEELQQQLANPTPATENNTIQNTNCNCTTDHNGILVTYSDITSCSNLQDEEQ